MYFNDPKRYLKFEGKLPYGLDIKMTNSEFVEYLGEPHLKQGGKLSNICLNYKHMGTEVEFYCKSWDVGDAPVAWICLYDTQSNLDQHLSIKLSSEQNNQKQSIEPKQDKICGVCRKASTNRCNNCKLVYYCGRDH